MNGKLLSYKFDGEKVVVTMDFSPSLSAGETLTGTPEITVAVNSGVDEAPGDILNGAPSIANSVFVEIPVKGGIKNCSYTIKAKCSTSNPNKVLELVAILPIYAQ